MAHFAIIKQSDNKVLQVIRVDNSKMGNPEQEANGIAHLEKVFKAQTPWGNYPQDVYYKQTSYNADSTTGKWYNFAGIGHTYDPINGAFIAPKPVSAPVTPSDPLDPLGGGLNSNSTTLGQWVLNNKFQWVFEPEVEIGPIEMLFRKVFTVSEKEQVKGSDYSTEHQSFNEGFKPTPIKMPWWKKVLQKLRKLFKN